MSKLNPGLYSSEDMSWQTPPELVDALLKFEGRTAFDLDAAAPAVLNGQQPIPALSYCTEEWNCGLRSRWGWEGMQNPLVWLNPPYGPMLQKFMKKAFEESLKGSRIWALIPARTETR